MLILKAYQHITAYRTKGEKAVIQEFSEFSPSDRHGGFINTQTHIAALKQEIVKKDEECSRWKRLYERASSELKRLKSYLSWENRLFAVPSSEMSDAHKIVARALPSIVEAARARMTTDDARDDGLVRVFMDEVAAPTGKSDDSVSKALKEMHERGTVQRDFKKGYNKAKGTAESAVFLGIPSELMSLRLPAAPPRNTGNNQKNHILCKSCGSELVQVRKVIQGICPSCGTVHIYDLSRKEDRAFIVDAETAQNWQEWYSEVPDPGLEEMLVETETLPAAQPGAKNQRVLCGHDKKYWYKNADGSPGCELCDAPWGKP